MRRILLTIAMIVIANGAAAQTLSSGKYCIHRQGRAFDLLLARPLPDNGLMFGLSIWTTQGNNFAVAGIARPEGQGTWIYRDGLNSPDPDRRCILTIRRAGDGGYTVATQEGARCAYLAGRNAVMTSADTFPASSRVTDAPQSFNIESLMSADCEAERHADRNPATASSRMKCPARYQGRAFMQAELYDGPPNRGLLMKPHQNAEAADSRITKPVTGWDSWNLTPHIDGLHYILVCRYNTVPHAQWHLQATRDVITAVEMPAGITECFQRRRADGTSEGIMCK